MYNALVLKLDDVLNLLKIDKDKPFYFTVANHIDSICEVGEPIPMSVRYKGHIYFSLTDKAFIICHQDRKSFTLAYDCKSEAKLTILGNLLERLNQSGDREFAILLDMVDGEYSGSGILNLDDEETLECMRLDEPDELEKLLTKLSTEIK